MDLCSGSALFPALQHTRSKTLHCVEGLVRYCEASPSLSQAAQRFPGVISTLSVREFSPGPGLSTCERGGVPRRQREPPDREPPRECQPPLAWLDFSPLAGFSRRISGTRPVRCGSLTDPWARSLCSQEE